MGLRPAFASVIPWLAGEVAMLCARCAHEVAAGAQRCPSCSGNPLLDGRYRLERQLGHDSLGTSYRAVRVDDATLVRARSCMLRRLPDRSTMLRELDHPSLPRWLDELVVGDEGLATLWLIHEHVAGPRLSEALAAAPERRFDQARIIAVLRDLAEVLAYLHDRPTPIVHGSLAPTLVQLRADPRERCVLELGCGASAAVHGASSRGLAEGLAYSAPEQIYADPTPASDVWALGAIAVVALSGQSLQKLRDGNQRLRWRERLVVDPKLAALLERMLEADPARRISAAQLRRALAELTPAPQLAVTRAPELPRTPDAANVPIKRPEELSQAHHAASTLAQRQRTQLVLARVLVVIVTAVIAGLATWVVLH